jgi:hypothetical protein
MAKRKTETAIQQCESIKKILEGLPLMKQFIIIDSVQADIELAMDEQHEGWADELKADA